MLCVSHSLFLTTKAISMKSLWCLDDGWNPYCPEMIYDEIISFYAPDVEYTWEKLKLSIGWSMEIVCQSSQNTSIKLTQWKKCSNVQNSNLVEIRISNKRQTNWYLARPPKCNDNSIITWVLDKNPAILIV